MASSEGNWLFADNFCANLDKQMLIWFNLQGDETERGGSLKLQLSLLHQSMFLFKAGLSSQVIAGQNIKDVPDIPIKMLKKIQCQTQVYKT